MSSHADFTPYISSPAVLATSLDVNQLSSSQRQSIIQQLQSRVQISYNVAACTTASCHGSTIFIWYQSQYLF